MEPALTRRTASKDAITGGRGGADDDLHAVTNLRQINDRTQPAWIVGNNAIISQAHIKLQSKNFFDFAHGQSPSREAGAPFRGEAACHCVVPRRLACGNHSEAQHLSGTCQLTPLQGDGVPVRANEEVRLRLTKARSRC